jgi:hypothetical protein
MKNDVRSSIEQREDFGVSISEEINDMFVCLEPGCREIFSDDELEDVGLRIIEFDS